MYKCTYVYFCIYTYICICLYTCILNICIYITFLPLRVEAPRSLMDFLASAIMMILGIRKVARPAAPVAVGSAARRAGANEDFATAV